MNEEQQYPDKKPKWIPKTTIFVGNLQPSLTSESLIAAFEDIGPIKRAYIIPNKSDPDRLPGIGYVVFHDANDAEAALKVRTVSGKPVRIKYADPSREIKRVPRRFLEQQRKAAEEKGEVFIPPVEHQMKVETQDNDFSEPKRLRCLMIRNLNFQMTEDELMALVVPYGFARCISQQRSFNPDGTNAGFAIVLYDTEEQVQRAQQALDHLEVKGRPLQVFIYTKEAVERNKKVHSKENRRIIIRNVPFKMHDDQLRKLAKKHGAVESFSVPTKPSGEKIGTCFISYTEEESAAAAIKYFNSTPLMGRQVAADMALGKREYLALKGKTKPTNLKSSKPTNLKSSDNGSFKTNHNLNTIKKFKEEDIKVETPESESDEESENSEENESGEDNESEESESGEENETDDESESEIDSSSEEDDSENESKPKKIKKRKAETEGSAKPPKRQYETSSSDVHEEKTLLIRNLSYDTTEEALFEHLSQFGALQYAKLTFDPHTQRSRGVGFIKFEEKEDADTCLESINDPGLESHLLLDGRTLSAVVAVSRDKVSDFKAKKAQKDDKRNLYLARVGLVREGTRAAIGLSQRDITRRMNLTVLKQNKLKNPCVFISPLRLSVHNLPVYVDDKQLKEVIWKCTGDRKAWMTECRVIRDQNSVDEKGVAKSRGYGFVAFENHDNAMAALEALNNNPDVFGPQRRPIVEFAMENIKALQIKEKRLEVVRTAQAKRREMQPDRPKSNARDKRGRRHPIQSKISPLDSLRAVKRPQGVQPGLPSRIGPKIRHNRKSGALTRTEQKTEKRKERRKEYERAEHTEKQVFKQPRPKKRDFKDQRDDFDALVNNYKSKLSGIKTNSKWFE